MVATSLMVFQDSVMITEATEANNKLDVAVINLPGSFLHADMDEVVNMSMVIKLLDIMVLVAPWIYRTFLIYSKNLEAIMYVTLQKALYG